MLLFRGGGGLVLGMGGGWEMLAGEGGGKRWVGCCGLVLGRWLV